jgi:predicted metal-dependent peptidase
LGINIVKYGIKISTFTTTQSSAILPALESHQIDIIVAIDTSGSISQEEVNEFVSEYNQVYYIPRYM